MIVNRLDAHHLHNLIEPLRSGTFEESVGLTFLTDTVYDVTAVMELIDHLFDHSHIILQIRIDGNRHIGQIHRRDQSGGQCELMSHIAGQLYTAYCQELLKLPGCENWRIKTSLLARSTSISDQDRRPAILICDAARRLEDSFQILKDWSERESRLQTEEALGSLCKNRERKQIAEGFLHAKSWLGLGNEGKDLHSTYGFIPTAIFASALAWTDRFPDCSANKEIVRVLMLQLLFANLHERSDSVLKVLFMKESVAATQFSGHVQGALWRFMRTARCKWDLMEWLQKFEYLLTRILDTVSSNELKQNVQQYESLTTLRDSLSLYLSF